MSFFIHQNTRLIKDLQALRQNKANDQVLAKRIKNLLRKWKERLAAVVPASTASHPNSPQNFSQGSSDATIFMTQQSQSPPNSLPATSLSSTHQHHRHINGPTTFVNLIPKESPSAVTSPAIPPPSSQPHLNNNYNSHIHQNGGFNESWSCSSSLPTTQLLGKRKFEGNGNDIDENSNHSSRRKMAKKSMGTAFGQISSPNIPTTPFQNNNSYPVNNLKSVPVLQPQLLQNQPTPPLPQIQAPATILQQQQQSSLLLEEPPKKRGRRKGSKGIDSTLNGSAISTDFTTEIQQKIALSAGKRNKTTFELQKMLTESHNHQQKTINSSLVNGDTVDSSSVDRG